MIWDASSSLWRHCYVHRKYQTLDCMWQLNVQNVNPVSQGIISKDMYYYKTGRYDYHYDDVIMGAMASQITSLTIVYSTVYAGLRSKKTSKLRATGLCLGNSPGADEFLAQMASNAENVSIWWRHHDIDDYMILLVKWEEGNVYITQLWSILATSFQVHSIVSINILLNALCWN